MACCSKNSPASSFDEPQHNGIIEFSRDRHPDPEVNTLAALPHQVGELVLSSKVAVVLIF
jgi:hypothetical protein